jgi:dethiobiotin synthetase
VNVPPVIVITGTDTGVGKTITTAALAALLATRGQTVAVYKPCQTGAAIGDSDIAEVQRLAGTKHTAVGVVLQHPLAPVPAAHFDGVELPTISDHVKRVRQLMACSDHVLVEGSGGLLVELDSHGGTIAELAVALGCDAVCMVVARATLGTMNHVGLTMEAMYRRGLVVFGLVLGTWPASPGLVETTNRDFFDSAPFPLLGVVPENASQFYPTQFQAQASEWFREFPE